jgi:hypothetical protein
MQKYVNRRQRRNVIRANVRLRIACQDVHFTSIEDIYLKSSIPEQSSILRVKERSPFLI